MACALFFSPLNLISANVLHCGSDFITVLHIAGHCIQIWLWLLWLQLQLQTHQKDVAAEIADTLFLIFLIPVYMLVFWKPHTSLAAMAVQVIALLFAL